jgi:hypothetical protein
VKGTNTLQLNSATICEAIEEYFDKRWKGLKLSVTHIDQKVGPYGGEFLVTVTTQELPEENES